MRRSVQFSETVNVFFPKIENQKDRRRQKWTLFLLKSDARSTALFSSSRLRFPLMRASQLVFSSRSSEKNEPASRFGEGARVLQGRSEERKIG